MMPTAPGSVVAQRFELLAPAGVGGMATVFRARDLETGRLVALKLLPSASQQPQDLSRFVREAQLLSELSHPGIVSYIAHGRPEHGVPYLAMEWLEGEDLGSRLARGPLTLDESLIILTKTTAALAVAHSRGIVHRERSTKHRICLQVAPENLHRRRQGHDRAQAPQPRN